jgi:hypothetical protein
VLNPIKESKNPKQEKMLRIIHTPNEINLFHETLKYKSLNPEKAII